MRYVYLFHVMLLEHGPSAGYSDTTRWFTIAPSSDIAGGKTPPCRSTTLRSAGLAGGPQGGCFNGYSAVHVLSILLLLKLAAPSGPQMSNIDRSGIGIMRMQKKKKKSMDNT